jgi:hypothetical protein
MVCHDTAPAHSVLSVCEFLAEKKMTDIPYPTYSCDLLPYDLPKLKMALKGRRSNVTMIQAKSQDSLITKFETLHSTKCLDGCSVFGLNV